MFSAVLRFRLQHPRVDLVSLRVCDGVIPVPGRAALRVTLDRRREGMRAGLVLVLLAAPALCRGSESHAPGRAGFLGCMVFTASALV